MTPTTPVRRREDCRLCRGTSLVPVLDLTPTPPGDHYPPFGDEKAVQPAYPIEVVLCPDCGHVGLAHVVDPDLLYGNYIYTTSVSLGLSDHYRRYAENIIQRFQPSPNGLVVEFGSNDGTMLKYYQDQGFRVLGVDPGELPAERARSMGVETWVDYFDPNVAARVKEKHGPASIIIANMVLANIDDLDDIARAVRNLLADDGIFVFETGYLVDLVDKKLIDNIYHEHLSYFAVKPLASFFKKHHLELIDAGRNDSKGGALRCVVKLESGSRPVDPSVDELIRLEKKMRLTDPDSYDVLPQYVNRIGSRLQALLADRKNQGRVIAGYGASVGSTTLIYLFELHRYLSFMLDDNPMKHHTLSPGHHIPVLPSDDLYSKRPDDILIIAWRFAPAIMEKHQAFSRAGGRFILPMPEVEIK